MCSGGGRETGINGTRGASRNCGNSCFHTQYNYSSHIESNWWGGYVCLWWSFIFQGLKRNCYNFRLSLMKKSLVFLTSLFTGACASPRITREYPVKPFKIFLVEPNKIKCEKPCGGYQIGRELYIPYSLKRDINGQFLPDFEILGHELWHLSELGGKYHK